tara:strand:- start:80 stop:1276 length:1197 start_codon:yes stop_codon:yes gene_type:complete
VILLIFILSIVNRKIRTNFINGYRTRQHAKRDIRQGASGKQIIIMHAASAGEFEQLKPILRAIDKNKYFIVQTFLSPTIYKAESNSTLFDTCCYHPLDLPWSALFFLSSFKPSIYLTTRHDIWPHHLVIARMLNIKCYLINANLYQNSRRLNPIFKSLNKFVFNKFDKILTGSDSLKNIFTQLVPENKIIVTGDSRFDQIIYRTQNPKSFDQFNEKHKYIIFGSIDDDDLKIIKETIIKFDNPCKYIIVPHEVNKSFINKIESVLNDININNICLTKMTNHSIDDYKCIIVDTVGNLLDLYKYADIAYVGAGFTHGVHSIIEPLAQNCIVCYGPKIDILDEAIEITDLKIGSVINNANELLNIFKLIENEEFVAEKQNEGLDYIKRRGTSSNKILNHI